MPTLARIAFLKGTEYFVGFGAEELHLLASATDVRTFAAGEPLFRQGDKPAELHILMRGKVELRRDGLLLDTLGLEEIVGETGLFDETPHLTSAIAIEPVETLSISAGDLSEVLAQAPAVALALLKAMSRKLSRAWAPKTA